MNWNAFYFLPFLFLPIIIHLIGKKPDKEIKFPPFEILKRIYREYRWYLKIRNLLLLIVRVGILLLFIVSASKLSCGFLPEKKEGIAIVIDSSYSTMVFDGNKRIIQKEIEMAKELLTKVADARVFKCSDTLYPIFIDEVINGNVEPDFRSGNAKTCYETIKRMGFSEVFWITDGRKEGYEGLPVKGVKIIDISQGKKFPNAWIERVEIKGETIELELKSNERINVGWELKSNISESRGKIDLKGEEIVKIPFNPASEWIMIKINGDSLDADNYHFIAKRKQQRGIIGIFNFSPSEVPYMDEGFYIKKALSTLGENFIIKEKVPSTMTGIEMEEYSFLFILNPLWNPYVKEVITNALKKKIPIFLSAGEGGGFKEVCEFLGIEVRDVKEIESLRKLTPNFENPLASAYPEEIFDDIYIEKLYLIGGFEWIEPIIYLSNSEPLLLKLTDKDVFILTTTADLDWSQFPITRVFVPLVIDILSLSLKNEEVSEFSGGFSVERGGRVVVKADMEFSAVPGIYEKNGKTIVANLHPTEESLLTPISSSEFEGDNFQKYSGFQIWKYAILLTGLFLLLESFLLK